MTFTDEEVLRQAIAADYLMWLYGHSDTVLLGLWHCGYPVSTATAKSAWLTRIEREYSRRSNKASQYRDHFLGLSKSWWRRLPVQTGYDTTSLLDFMTETVEWQYDEAERDDDAYRLRLIEIFSWLDRTKGDRSHPSKTLTEAVERIWTEMDFPSLARPVQSMDFIRSMTETELEAVRGTLVELRQIIEKFFTLFNGANTRPVSEIGSTRLMQGLIGPFFTKVLIQSRRNFPEIPISKSVSAIHEYVMELKLGDLAIEEEWQLQLSKRARKRWQRTTQALAELWEPTSPQKPLQ